MPLFEFELIFALPQSDCDTDQLADRIFEATCGDVLIGEGTRGLLALAVSRSGDDAMQVISDAMSGLLDVLPSGASLREVKPDLVSQGEVAARLGVTKQALQKRELPPVSLGGLYRATEIFRVLEAHPGKMSAALEQARPWFAAAPAAQKINAEQASAALNVP